MKTMFPWLFAQRFWAMALGVASVYAEMKGWIAKPEMVAIAAFTSGFVGIRTIDRATEQGIIASAVGSGQLTNAAVEATPGLTTEPVKDTLKPIEESAPDEGIVRRPDLERLIREAVAKALHPK